ncbi:hypothetical protein C2S53_010578 [Perilla frutescens var. hirtella]|uniref:SWIM-type domain-containing protein n=1 Tax=Perilla frutescens var. hirtella TaxID=608512 RepID=A0AAD4JED7_PERFH|nr:hypothetical protein C2S53_010578 [Perilla frutescens var. hirtella]
MVRHRIIVRHSGRWERAQYVDGVEEQIIMSSDGFCFRSLIREIHELLETDPTSVECQLSWMSSTNSGRQIKTRLKDDADLLDLIHEQSSELVVYVVQRGCSSSRVIPDTVPEERDPAEPSEAHTDTLHKGAIFRTKDDLALAVGLYHMQNRVKECPFKLCPVVDGVVWRIYKFNDTHTCHIDMSRIAPRQVPARVIAKHFARKLVDEGVVLKPKEMMFELLREYVIQIDYSFTLRSRNIAIEMIYGDYDKSYAQLPAFLHMVQLRNPGTLYEFLTTSENQFQYMFLALGPCIRAFQDGSRPVVMIDGTHLKGRNKGILFVATTKDGNEQILPIAIGLDQHQSIKNAVAAVFLRAAHGLCYYHLQNKMAKRGVHVIAMFKEAAYAYRTDVFQRHMSVLELVSTPAYQKLCRIGPEHWSLSQCPARRFSFMTSNAAESLNARLLWARRLPICSMLEVFRRIVEEWFVEQRAAAQSWDHVLTPEAVNKESFMVDLQHRTCDCREFELDLIPCSHAAAAIRFSGGHIYDFVDRCYKTETVVSMYDSVIMGLPSSEEWISPPYGSPLVLAPVIKKQAGRPRMSRARGGVEASSRSRRQVCTRYHGPGHNRRVCTAQIPIGGVDLNAPPEDVPTKSACKRAPKKCSVCGETMHTRPRCPTRQTTDLD